MQQNPGSPPRMRGKASPGQRRRPAAQDHPRVCGEKFWYCDSNDYQRGSPPRMRGKVLTAYATDKGFGITPAYAGKSRPPECRCSARWDHPRVCGEKRVCRFPAARKWGSPPRMRGKVSVFSSTEIAYGITPAYAGKSCQWRGLPRQCGDHPRVCGEKTKKIP